MGAIRTAFRRSAPCTAKTRSNGRKHHMRKGDETKREILRAAEQLFCQKGYEAASMQEIVRAAGVSKGGIYHHFASKEEIMTLLSHQHAQESAERAEAQLADAPDDLAREGRAVAAALYLGYQ